MFTPMVGRRAPFRGLCIGLVLTWSVIPGFASELQVAADEPSADGSLVRMQQHLQSAERLRRLGFPRLATEHLLEVDGAALPEEWLLNFTQLLQGVVAASPTISAAFESYLLQLLEDERLQPYPSLWYAWGEVSIRRRRVGPAIEAWNRGLDLRTYRDLEIRSRVILRALTQIRRLGRSHLQYDPEVQAGALEAFIERRARGPAHFRSEIAGSAYNLHILIDPDAPEAKLWAERYLDLNQASPEALRQRGDLEISRFRPDLALPWYLWGAYSSPLRSKYSPSLWRRLGRVYRDLGWCDLAAEAEDLALSERPPRDCQPLGPLSKRTEECRDWHDSLLAYYPERVMIQWQGSWRGSVPDLAKWQSRCEMRDLLPVPSCRSPYFHNRSWVLPSRARADLYRSPQPSQALCALTQSTVLPPRFVEFMQEPEIPEERMRYDVQKAILWEAQAHFALRMERLEDSLQYMEKSLDASSEDRKRSLRFFRYAQAAASSPSSANPKLLRFQSRWLASDLVKRPENRAHEIFKLASGFREGAPRSPEALHWANEAMIAAPSGILAWNLVGGVRLDRDQPAEALPFFLWAYRALPKDDPNVSEYRDRDQREISKGLIESYTRLRWWDLALELIEENSDEEIPSLPEEHLLPPVLPPTCRDLHDQMSELDFARVLETSGKNWRAKVPLLARWQAECVRLETGPAS